MVTFWFLLMTWHYAIMPIVITFKLINYIISSASANPTEIEPTRRAEFRRKNKGQEWLTKIDKKQQNSQRNRYKNMISQVVVIKTN